MLSSIPAARSWRAALVVLAALAVQPSVQAQLSYSRGQTVSPGFEGWERDSDGRLYFLFGYMNRNWLEELDVPIGPDNFITPGEADQGQPTHFLPRRNRFVFRVPVPQGFSESDELIWTLRARGEARHAYATLRFDYFVDDLVKASEQGAIGAGTTDPVIRANEAPNLEVESEETLRVRVGEPLTLVAVAGDDGVPKPRDRRRSLLFRRTSQGENPNPSPNPLWTPPRQVTVGSSTGLRLSWYVYRGAGKVTFEPAQNKVWEDTRTGANSPWAPNWYPPPVPADGKFVTDVTFHDTGTYVLRCLASDGALGTDSDVTVTVTPGPWPQARAQERPYYPPAGEWQRKKPEEVGMDADLLAAAIEYAQSQETSKPMDFSDQEEIFGKLLGPIPTLRAHTNGLVIRHGYIVAEFGDTSKVDPTYSAAKSYLSTIAGLSVDRGLISDVHDRVAKYINDGGYDSPQSSKVTWHHHLQQTSEWEGELWGKKHDFVGSEAFGRGERKPRVLQAPGSYYEYNDVRINRLALSLLTLWRRPLPQVLADEIMNPIGASDTWRYLGYHNADVEIDGQVMRSVTGGTRWGAGLWINSFDQARFGYLFLRNGKWEDRQIISEKWIRTATTRGTVGPDYGYLWWLNSEGRAWPDAPKTAYRASGHGSNTVWIDPEHDLVVVWRWHQGRASNELYRRILESIVSE